MPAQQKRPGTTTPTDRIHAKVQEKLEPGILVGDKESNPNTKTGSKFGKRRRARKDPRPKLHRKQGSRKKAKTKKGVKMNDIVAAVRYIIRNHGNSITETVAGFRNRNLLVKAATKCMATCLSGWVEKEHELMSENTNMVLSKDSWMITQDGSASLNNGFQFDYDWLYDLANSDITPLTEDIDETELDKDAFSDALSNASNLLRKLSDKEVKKYILNAAKGEENVDLMNLKEILEDSGVNWRFTGAEIDGDKINLLIRVRYSADGTQEGVVEKKLSIEVKPSADVTEKKPDQITNDDEVNLSFPGSDMLDQEIETDLPEKSLSDDRLLEPDLDDLPPDDLPPKELPEEEIEGGIDDDLDIGIRL